MSFHQAAPLNLARGRQSVAARPRLALARSAVAHSAGHLAVILARQQFDQVVHTLSLSRAPPARTKTPTSSDRILSRTCFGDGVPTKRRDTMKKFTPPTVSTSRSSLKPGDPEPIVFFGLTRLALGPAGSLIALIRALQEEGYFHWKLAQERDYAPPTLEEMMGGLEALAFEELERRAAGKPPTPTNDLPSYLMGGDWSEVERALMAADFDIMALFARHGVDVDAFQPVDDIFAGPCPFADEHEQDGLMFVDPATRLWLCTGCRDAGDPRWFVLRKLGLRGRDLLTFFELELGLRAPEDTAA